MKPHDISELAPELGHEFRDTALLQQALTHSSYAREAEQQNDGQRVGDSEQLEFLGDAVLGFVTSQQLFQRYPEFSEGQLSKLRAHLVSEQHLIRAARKLHLGRYLRLGKGEEKSGGRTKTALLVDALEAVLASLYLDAGLEATRELILDLILEPELKRLKRQVADGLPITDYKSALQEMAHSSSRPQPEYVLVREQGPEHKKTFTVEARLLSPDCDGKPDFVGEGKGHTKKTAEQDAAREALDYLVSLRDNRDTRPARTRKTH
jgi:ribonuclease-3